jgi:hypothetical protein
MRSVVAILVGAAALAACGGEDEMETGPLMRPGENCLACHTQGGEADEHRWTAAGTVFRSPTADPSEGVEGAIVRIRGADGNTIELRTNAAGNFYTTERLAADPSPEVEFEGRLAQMGTVAGANGACNNCHNQPPQNEAPGRIYVLP